MKELYDNYFKDLIPLISVIVVVIGWIVNYNANRKHKIYESFLSKTENNVVNILEPMTRELRSIMNESHSNTKTRKLHSFIEKYCATDSPLILATESDVISYFRNLELNYHEYKLKPSEKNMENVYMALCMLEEHVSKKLNEYRDVLFKNYNWFYKLERSNPVIALFYDTFRILYLTVAGISKILIGLSVIIYLEYLAYLHLKFLNLYFHPILLYILPFTFLFSVFWMVLFAINLNLFRIGMKEKHKLPRTYNLRLIQKYKEKYPNLFLNEDTDMQRNNT